MERVGNNAVKIRMSPRLLDCLFEMGDPCNNADGLDEFLTAVYIPDRLAPALMDRIETCLLADVAIAEAGAESQDVAELLFTLYSRNQAKAKA